MQVKFTVESPPTKNADTESVIELDAHESIQPFKNLNRISNQVSFSLNESNLASVIYNPAPNNDNQPTLSERRHLIIKQVQINNKVEQQLKGRINKQILLWKQCDARVERLVVKNRSAERCQEMRSSAASSRLRLVECKQIDLDCKRKQIKHSR